MKYKTRLTWTFVIILILNFIVLWKIIELRRKKYMCSKFPRDAEIPIDHEIWQTLTIPKGDYKITNAYVDDRENETVVRVMMAGYELDYRYDHIYCQFWFEDSPNTVPFVQKATEYFMMWAEDMGKWDGSTLLPYLIKCPIEYNGEIPKFVSLTPKACSQATNRLKVIDNHPPDGVKKSFMVTSKPLVFDNRNYVIRFIEWMEMMRILGADKIDILYKSVHPELMRIMKYYENQDFLYFHYYDEPEGVYTHTYEFLQNFMLQMMQHSDCFYRNRNLYKYFVVLDTDEVIFPTRPEDWTWHDLMNKTYDMSKGIVSFMSWNAVLAKEEPLKPGIPEYHHMLQHTQRADRTNNLVKTIMIGDTIKSIYIHNAEFCLDGKRCKQQFMSLEDSICFHFRDKYLDPSDETTIEDTAMMKYKDELIKGVSKVLEETGFVP